MDILAKIQSEDITDIEIDKDELKQMDAEELKRLKTRLQDVIKDTELSLRSNVEEIGSRKIFKRFNKNRPVEMSSKIVTSMHRKVKQTTRDPRFEDACGTFDPERFKKRYGFLDEMKEKEKRIVLRKMKREKDPEKKIELQKVAQAITNQRVTNEDKERKTQITERLKEEAMKSTGKSFVNKSYVKKFALVDKFEQLKKTGKLDKYIEKKRKKLLNTARKKYDI